MIAALLVTLILVALAMLGMAVGLLAGKRLRGSCGGSDPCSCLRARLGRRCPRSPDAPP